jgi:hypothetical protein
LTALSSIPFKRRKITKTIYPKQMEANSKNYSPVYIGLGIGVGVSLLGCLITYLLMRYQKNREIMQLKATHEKDKKNSLDALSLQNKLENLRSRADFLAQLRADVVDANSKKEPENVVEQIIE